MSIRENPIWNNSLILQVRRTCLFRGQGEQTVALMNVETGHTFKVRGLGAYLFLKLDGHLNIGEVLDFACAKFRITDPMFHIAMDRFLRELFSLDVIQEISVRAANQAWPNLFDNKSLTIDIASLSIDRTVVTVAAGSGGSGYASAGGSGASGSSGCGGGGCSGSCGASGGGGSGGSGACSL